MTTNFQLTYQLTNCTNA